MPYLYPRVEYVWNGLKNLLPVKRMTGLKFWSQVKNFISPLNSLFNDKLTYMSCSAIYNEYDGVQHDYTRKQGLVWEHIFLPAFAPAEWQERAKLWNAVEEAEKTKDSRLAREFVAALPIELGKDEWGDLLSKFIQEQMVLYAAKRVDGPISELK